MNITLCNNIFRGVLMNHIKRLRLEAEITQISLQMQTGIDQSLISAYERGVRLPTVENLIVLARFYCTSLDYLMDRTDVKQPYPSKEESFA